MLFDGGGGGVEFEYKRIVWALIVLLVLPIIIPLMAPATVTDDSEWEQEILDLQSTYFRQSGTIATNEINVWALTGIYTPYDGTTHGRTDDGWLYGLRVTNDTPQQYNAPYWGGEKFEIQRNPANGLYYYISAPSNSPDIKAAVNTGTAEQPNWDYTGATVYSNVTMDVAYKSSTFFTSNGKTTEGDSYYYAYDGYRYAFSPLSSFTTTKDGVTYQVDNKTSSLSLIWYQYVNLNGIAGQLTITGKDFGVSYLTADDIVRAYDSTNLSATFDMKFGNIPMHLLISLNPMAVASGLTISDIWNSGYWSVMVYSDQDAISAVTSQTNEFSPERILDTVIMLFTFDIQEEYDLDGWVAILASAIFSLSFYAVLIALALNHAYLWALVAIVAIFQSFKFTLI